MSGLAPIKTHIDALTTEAGYPAAAIEGCLSQADQAAPLLRAILQKAARGRALSEAEAEQLFLGLHILAKLRDMATFLPLMRLLRRREEELEDLLGDTITGSLPKIVASVFDGDEDSLFDMIADPTVEEFVRDAIWRAATFLTLSGEIPRERMHDFVEVFDDKHMSPSRDMGWVGWLDAIAVLGFDDLALRVTRIWRDDRLPKKTYEKEDFEATLAEARREPPDARWLRQMGLARVDDVAEALSWVDWDGQAATPMPIINPMRHVGRNDPCPCGSGKKAKKCCLATA